MVKKVVSAVLIFVGLSLIAQTDTTVKKNKISEASLQMGIVGGKPYVASLADFQKLNLQSTLLNNDFSNYLNDSYYHTTTNSMLSLNIGVKLADKEKNAYIKRPLLRIGVTYSTNTVLHLSMSHTTETPADTLVSTQTGTQMYVDTTTQAYYNFSYETQQLQLDVSLLFSTNSESRWSVYGGIGVLAGVTFNNFTQGYYSYSQYLSPNYLYNYEPLATDYNMEFKANKSGWAVAAYIPVGLDFRLGNNREFWKKLHLFYEMRPSLSFTYIPELRTYISVRNTHSLGVRVRF